jgi:uncharacterized protein (DUF983 family)
LVEKEIKVFFVTDYPPLSPLKTGLACKCPRCGEGDLYQGFLTLKQQCPSCGLDYSKADSGDGPAVFMIFIVGFLSVLAAMILQLVLHAPIWLVLGLSVGLTIVLIATLIRPLKAIMVAQQYAEQAAEGHLDHGGDD